MILISLFVTVALAHKPSFGESYDSLENAYSIADPDVSIVLYQEITCDMPQVWLEFVTPTDFPLYVQLGVPVVDWLQGYRPSVAVVAEGLPLDTEVPFALPENMGAVVYTANQEYSEFYEPFTQTSSWVWVEERITVSGHGYIVGWHPENQTGKIWIATGETEDFSDVSVSDFAYWNEAVNNFHETGRFEPAVAKGSMDCDDVVEEEPKENTGACAVASPLDWGVFSLLMGVVAVLRRQQGV